MGLTLSIPYIFLHLSHAGAGALPLVLQGQKEPLIRCQSPGAGSALLLTGLGLGQSK